MSKLLMLTTLCERRYPDLAYGGCVMETQAENSRIFVNHAHEDSSCADAIVHLLERTLPVDRSDIYCSSSPGCSTEPGKEWLKDIQQKIGESDVFLSVVSPYWFSSCYAPMELGMWHATGKKDCYCLNLYTDEKKAPHPFNGYQLTQATDRTKVAQLITSIADRSKRDVCEHHVLVARVDQFCRSHAAAGMSQFTPEEANSLDIDGIVNRIWGISNWNRRKQRGIRLRNEARELFTDSFYVTGGKETTRSAVFDRHTTVFIQGKNDLVRLQKHPLVPGSKRLRAPARLERRVESSSNGEVQLHKWVFIERGDRGYQPLKHHGLSQSYQFLTVKRDEVAHCYSVVLYRNIESFEGNVDYMFVDIENLTGYVRELEVLLGGHLEDIQFVEAYEFSNAGPARFSLVDDERCGRGLRTPTDMLQEFEKLFSSYRKIGATKSFNDLSGWALVREIWNEVAEKLKNEEEIDWGLESVKDVRKHCLFIMSGNYCSGNGDQR